MTREQFIYDCLIVLPKLYDSQERWSLRHARIKEFADNHGLDYETALAVAREWTPLSGLYPLISERYAAFNPGELRLPDGLKEVPWRAFLGDESITTVVIPDSVEIIEEDAFEQCSNLIKVRISENSRLRIIKSEAFKGCPFTDIYLPESTEIDPYAFQNTGYMADIFAGKQVCPENVFKSFFDFYDLITVCTARAEEPPPYIQKYLLDNLFDVIAVLCGTPPEESPEERLRIVFKIAAAKGQDINELMNLVIEKTEYSGNYSLRAAMLDYQHKLFPKQLLNNEFEL